MRDEGRRAGVSGTNRNLLVILFAFVALGLGGLFLAFAIEDVEVELSAIGFVAAVVVLLLLYRYGRKNPSPVGRDFNI